MIERAPSAELRHDQKDSDSLPPYEVLDAILELFIEDNLSVDEITARGFDRATVGRVLEMVKRNEYKRRQAPPGVRISDRAFGRDWRYPITSGYKTRGVSLRIELTRTSTSDLSSAPARSRPRSPPHSFRSALSRCPPRGRSCQAAIGLGHDLQRLRWICGAPS